MGNRASTGGWRIQFRASILSRRKIYISGPMSGYEGNNEGAFHDAEHRLRALGYEPLNPARHPVQDSWAAYLKLDIQDVLRADAVAVLPGWEASRGAKLEVHVAHALEIPVMPIEQWI